MTIQAKWGPFVWQVTNKMVRSFAGTSTGRELDLSTGKDKEGSTATNNKGLKLRTLNIEYQTSYLFNTPTRSEYDAWCSYVGKYATFFLGGRKFGPDYFQLTKVELKDVQLTGAGEFIQGKIGLTFTEYGYEAAELKPTSASSDATDIPEGMREARKATSAASLGATAEDKSMKAGTV